MKRLIPCLVVFGLCSHVCLGSIADDPEIADGYLTSGEYVNIAELEGSEELFVLGGADIIDVRDYGYLEVQDTAKPLGYHTGIYDITLYDNSELLYLGGVTEEITVRDDAVAVLKGGTIDGITIYHLPGWLSGITLYCQDGYQINAAGISGLWGDGTAFDIDFINPTGVFAPYPTANYVYVEIIPEPGTVALLGLGALMLRRK